MAESLGCVPASGIVHSSIPSLNGESPLQLNAGVRPLPSYRVRMHRCTAVLVLLGAVACRKEPPRRAVAAADSGAAAHGAATVPPAVRRRLGQAIWPEVLFDAAGQPVASTRMREMRGDPRGPWQTTRAEDPSALPGVEAWRLMAVRCIDCGVVRAAVAIRGADTVSVLNPQDLELLLRWVIPRPTRADSATIRRAALAFHNLTCVLGCDAGFVRTKADVAPDMPAGMREVFFHSAGGKGPWRVPPPQLTSTEIEAEYRLPLATGEGVYVLTVSWAYGAECCRYSAFAEPIAYFRLGP